MINSMEKTAKIASRSVKKATAHLKVGVHDFSALTREDIYRQRIFGDKSGSEEFIDVEDKRRLKPGLVFVYIIFVIVTTYYCGSKRVWISHSFGVNEAIRTAFFHQTFRAATSVHSWKDINTVEDVEFWLLNAFPTIVSPAVQTFNVPATKIRFTVRKIKQKKFDNRFKLYIPEVWQSSEGIAADFKSDENDDKEPYGAYREWNVTSLVWYEVPGHRCGIDEADLLDTQMYGAKAFNMTAAETRYAAISDCKRWCEFLVAPRPCRCFEVSENIRCDLYHMAHKIGNMRGNTELSLHENMSEAGISLGATSLTDEDIARDSLLVPRLSKDNRYNAYFPRIRKFTFNGTSTTQPGTDQYDGYKMTPGYVSLMPLYNYDEMERSLGPADLDEGRVKPSKMMQDQLKDWMQGGWLSRGTVAISIDFVTYNVNYDMFSWVQLRFTFTASGFVNKRFIVESLPAERDSTNTTFLDGLDQYDIIYMVLILFFILVEVAELCHRRIKYLLHIPNWICLANIGLNVMVIRSWAAYTSTPNYSVEQSDVMVKFSKKAIAYDSFKTFSAMNLLFVYVQLLHYLNDIFPRFQVLIDTIMRSVQPVFFMSMVILLVLLGFVFWATYMFGSTVHEFSSITFTFSTCVRMIFGDVKPYYALEHKFPYLGVMFFIPYIVMFRFIFINLNKAVLVAAYDDALQSFKESERKKEKVKQAEEDHVGEMFKKYVAKLDFFNLQEFFSKKVTKPADPLDPPIAWIVIYAAFAVAYTVLAQLMFRIEIGHILQDTITGAITTPTVPITNTLSGEQVQGWMNFDRIQTPVDVLGFMTKTLPAVLFNSSIGMLENRANRKEAVANPLKMYASTVGTPNEAKQLVISNWNILVGLNPVRITARYFAMDSVGATKHVPGSNEPHTLKRVRCCINGGKAANLSAPTVVSSSWLFANGGGVNGLNGFMLEAQNVSEIEKVSAREALRTYFRYGAAYRSLQKTDKNGFILNLGVDPAITIPILEALDAATFITDQTAYVAIEFVVYNAKAAAFAYTSIVFMFQPSGHVEKQLTVRTLGLEYNNGAEAHLRGILEVLVILINSVCFIYMLRDVWKIAVMSRLVGNEGRCGMLRSIVMFFLGDFFNILDVVSIILTYVTMALWYSYMALPLNKSYNFPDQPDWAGSCTPEKQLQPFSICSDDDVIQQFAITVWWQRALIQLLAVNFVLIFGRSLRFFRSKRGPFKRVRLLLATIENGLLDILWFMIMFGLILTGYVWAGHLVYGASIYGFSSMIRGMQYCFDMVLGRFDYEAMKDVDQLVTPAYFFSFMFIFKFLLMNMFLAIIFTYFEAEDKKLEEEHEKEAKEKRRQERKRKRDGGVEYQPKKRPGRFGWILDHWDVSYLYLFPQKEKASNGVRGAAHSPDHETGGRKAHGRVAASDTTDEGKPVRSDTEESAILNKGADSDMVLSDVRPGVDGDSEHAGSYSPRPPATDLQDFTSAYKDDDDSCSASDDSDHGTVQMTEDERLKHIAKIQEKVKKGSMWHNLPDDIKTWACKLALEVQLQIKVPTAEKQDAEEGNEDMATHYDPDKVDRFEEKLKEKLTEYSKQVKVMGTDLSQTELSELSRIHGDQETFSEHIIQSEAQLRALETKRRAAAELHAKLIGVSQDLIAADDFLEM